MSYRCPTCGHVKGCWSQEAFTHTVTPVATELDEAFKRLATKYNLDLIDPDVVLMIRALAAQVAHGKDA